MTWRIITDLGWVALALAWVTTEVLARRARSGQLTVAALVRVVTSSRMGRNVVLLAWMWLGWHVFAR